MTERRKAFGVGMAAGAAGLLVLGALAGVAVVYTGAYDVAATEPHNPLTRWALGTNFHRAVGQRATEAVPPGGLTPEMIAAGAGEYQAMCQHCHGGPGQDRAEWTAGMLPRPPQLAEAAAQWQPREVFWLIRNGVKMTGMPAFGPTHDAQTIWNITAFVKALPTMTPDRYTALTESAEAHEAGGHGHGHGGHGGGTH